MKSIKDMLLKMREDLVREIARRSKASTATGVQDIGDILDSVSEERTRELDLILTDREKQKLKQIDDAIESVSTNWRIDRMARVDRNVLRLAAHELLHRPGVPVKVVINEAIELGKKFGSESSGAFINGVLDRIAASLPASRRAGAGEE